MATAPALWVNWLCRPQEIEVRGETGGRESGGPDPRAPAADDLRDPPSNLAGSEGPGPVTSQPAANPASACPSGLGTSAPRPGSADDPHCLHHIGAKQFLQAPEDHRLRVA